MYLMNKQSLFSVCVLYLVCNLHFVPSLHFVLRLQSAVCILYWPIYMVLVTQDNPTPKLP